MRKPKFNLAATIAVAAFHNNITAPITNPIMTTIENKSEPELKLTRGGHARNLPPFRVSSDYTDNNGAGCRRITPKAVDVKRAARAAKREGK